MLNIKIIVLLGNLMLGNLLSEVKCISEDQEQTEKRTPKVFLTVSPIADIQIFSPSFQRAIILNYYDLDCERINKSFPFVGLFDHDPTKGFEKPLMLHKPIQCPEGRFETTFQFEKIDFVTKDNVSRCLGYWGAFIEAGKVVHSSCLSTHPDWMYKMRDVIGNRTLDCLMIPGTHDSGCYKQYKPYRGTVYDKFIFTQEESVFNQLVYGIRYLDLRIWHEGAYRWQSRMFITHDRFHLGLPELKTVLKEIKDFVEATNEIVVVDFHRKVTGFFRTLDLEDWQHREVIELVKVTFGDLLVDKEHMHETLNNLWKSNKRVVATYYGHDESADDTSVGFDVRHWWLDTERIEDLHRFLLDNSCIVGWNEMLASNAVLTPNMWMLVKDRTFSRRKLSTEINKKVNKWFRNEFNCANIVLTDFFLGNNIVEIAIDINRSINRCQNWAWRLH